MATPLPQTLLAPNIQVQLDVLAAAKADLSAAVIVAQRSCEHIVVSEMGYRSGGYAAQRICNHCRLVEEGSHWSGGNCWSKHDYSPSDLGNADFRIVLPVTGDQFHKMRIAV